MEALDQIPIKQEQFIPAGARCYVAAGSPEVTVHPDGTIERYQSHVGMSSLHPSHECGRWGTGCKGVCAGDIIYRVYFDMRQDRYWEVFDESCGPYPEDEIRFLCAVCLDNLRKGEPRPEYESSWEVKERVELI